MKFQPGTSGNPGGRPRGAERVAREEADRWAEKRGISGEHAGVRALVRVACERIEDPTVEDKDRIGYLKLVIDRVAGKPREIIEVDTKPEMTDEEMAAELDIAVREAIAKMSPAERLKLLTDPAPAPTIQ